MIRENFRGTWQIIRLLFRQHRLKIALWTLGIVGISIIVAFAFPEVYQTQEDIMGFAITMENPAMVAMLGVLYDTESFNVGALFASEMLLFTAIAVAIMNILLMSGMSRDDEQEGRLEIIQSLPVGKISYLTAGILLLLGVNLIITLLMTGGLVLNESDVFNLESSLLYSLVLTTTGLFFAGLTAVVAQLTETTYGTKQFAFGALILFYIIRMIGDVQNETLSLFSPLGWTVRSDVFISNDWWPIFALSIGFVLLTGIAFYLRAKRDMFAGILPSRRGKANASSFLKSIPGFIFNLQLPKIIGWFILIFGLSATFGAILGELETYFSDIEILQQILAGSAGENMIEQFIAYLFAIMSVFSLFPALSIMISLRSEENAQRIEHFYTRPVSRTQIFSIYFIYSVLTGALMQFGIASGVYVTSSSVLEDTISFNQFMKMSFVYFPAILVVIGLIALFVGFIPKLTHAIWLYITYIFVVLYLGSLLDFPEWANNLSVFSHVPEYPNEAIDLTVLSILAVIGIVLAVLGLVGYNKRDIAA